jgi:hypothetical protein
MDDNVTGFKNHEQGANFQVPGDYNKMGTRRSTLSKQPVPRFPPFYLLSLMKAGKAGSGDKQELKKERVD